MNKVLCAKKCPYCTYVNMNYKRNESFSKGFIYLRSLISCWINIMKYICVQASHLRKFSTVLYFVVLHLMWHIIKKCFFPRGRESSL